MGKGVGAESEDIVGVWLQLKSKDPVGDIGARPLLSGENKKISRFEQVELESCF